MAKPRPNTFKGLSASREAAKRVKRCNCAFTFRCAVKPTPSIFREQQTVDMAKRENATLALEGRHDPVVVHRAAVVVDSVTALVLWDALAMRLGTDWLAE